MKTCFWFRACAPPFQRCNISIFFSRGLLSIFCCACSLLFSSISAMSRWLSVHVGEHSVTSGILASWVRGVKEKLPPTHIFSAYLNSLGNTKEKIIIWTPTDRGPTRAFHIYIEKAGVIHLCCCKFTISSNLESPFLSSKDHITFYTKASTRSGAIWDQLWSPISITVIW